MKVALIDNMNNSFFAFCRYLRDLGVDADLYCAIGAHDHFTPDADTFESAENLPYIYKLPFSMSRKSISQLGRGKLRSIFGKYDILIACGGAPAFLHADGLRVDVFVPYGSDLYLTPFPRYRETGFARYFPSLLLAQLQRKAIRNSRRIAIDSNYGLYRDALQRLGVQADKSFSPMVYVERAPTQADSFLAGWRASITDSDFIVFNHSRQYWRSNLDNLPNFERHLGAKRNDKLIRAFASFLATTSYKKPLLVLFEYGPDVSASKELIAALGIEKFTLWQPKTHRKYILQMLKDASIACNAFREDLDGIGGVSLEALAAGAPLLNNMSSILLDEKHIFHKSPIVHALSEGDILKKLVGFERDPQSLQSVRKSSERWFDEHLGIGLARQYLDMMSAIYREKAVRKK